MLRRIFAFPGRSAEGLTKSAPMMPVCDQRGVGQATPLQKGSPEPRRERHTHTLRDAIAPDIRRGVPTIAPFPDTAPMRPPVNASARLDALSPGRFHRRVPWLTNLACSSIRSITPCPARFSPPCSRRASRRSISIRCFRRRPPWVLQLGLRLQAASATGSGMRRSAKHVPKCPPETMIA